MKLTFPWRDTVAGSPFFRPLAVEVVTVASNRVFTLPNASLQKLGKDRLIITVTSA